MQYLDYNEHILHGTPDRPIACYYVDEKHPRYRMPMHWHIECEIIRVRRGVSHLYVDDARIAARAGDLVFLGKGALHGGAAQPQPAHPPRGERGRPAIERAGRSAV